ncbi:MAG: response regulator, partial [Nocardioidaceae bacterium]
PALIVMDLSMPGIDGWEATRRIKHDARTRNIPVVALTAFVHTGNVEAMARVRDAGCDALLSKPCLPEDLAAEISRLLPA